MIRLVGLVAVCVPLCAQFNPLYDSVTIPGISNFKSIGATAANSRGAVAFIGRSERGGKIYENLYFFDPSSNRVSAVMNPIFEYPNSGDAPTQTFGDTITLTDSDEVIAQRQLNAIALAPCIPLGGVTSTVPLTYIEKWSPQFTLPEQILMANAQLQQALGCLLNPVTPSIYPSPLALDQPFLALFQPFAINASNQIASQLLRLARMFASREGTRERFYGWAATPLVSSYDLPSPRTAITSSRQFADAPAAIADATATGNSVEITGVQAAPEVCVRIKPDITTSAVGPIPEFETVRAQTRAFTGPTLLVIKADSTGDQRKWGLFVCRSIIAGQELKTIDNPV